MPTTDAIRFQTVLDSTENPFIQGEDSLVGTGTGDCIFQNNATTKAFVTLGDASNNVPGAAVVDSFQIKIEAKRVASEPDPHTLSVTASVGRFELTSSLSVSSTNYTVYTINHTNPDSSKITPSTIDDLQLTLKLEDLDTTPSPNLRVKGVNSGGDKKPSIEVTYSPIRWARVLTSGSNFPVTVLTQSEFANQGTGDNSGRGFTLINDQGHFKQTSSLNYNNKSTFRHLNLNKGAATSQSLWVSGSATLGGAGEATITASGTPDRIPIPTSGDFRSSLVFMSPFNSGPRGRFFGYPVFAVENVLTYEGSKVATTNLQLKSGSTSAPFEPYHGDDSEEDGFFDLPGDAIGFTGLNSDNVGYADYNPFGGADFIRIKRTSPQRGPSDDLKFYITASFAVPYSSSFGSPAGLEAYIVRLQPSFNDRRIIEAGDINIGVGLDPQIGMFTGSVILPLSQNDLLLETEKIQLRIKNKNQSKPVSIAFTGSGAAKIELENEYNANLKPSFYFDVNMQGSFEGTAWSSYSGSLSGVEIEDIPESQGITRGAGLIFRNTSSFTTIWYGQKSITASIRLAGTNVVGNMLSGKNITGLNFTNVSGSSQAPYTYALSGSTRLNQDTQLNYPALSLTSSIIGEGIQLQDSTLDEWQLKLSGSQLSLNSFGYVYRQGELHIKDSTISDGLDFDDGVIHIATASVAGRESGLRVGIMAQSLGLALTASLPGTGLIWEGGNAQTSRTTLTTTSGQVVSTSGSLTYEGPTLAQALGVGNSAAVYESATAKYGDNNSIIYDFYPGFIDSLGVGGRFVSLSGSITASTTTPASTFVRVGDNGVNNSTVKLNTLITTHSIIAINRSTLTSPWQYQRGGILLQQSTTGATGSLLFYDSGSPCVFDGTTIERGGWFITTHSFYKSPSSLPSNPFSSTELISSDTASFDSSSGVGMIQGVRTFDGNNVANRSPNSLNDNLTLYDPDSITKYGSLVIDTGSGGGSDSPVWIYQPSGL